MPTASSLTTRLSTVAVLTTASEICHPGAATCLPAMHQDWGLGRTLLHVVADQIPEVDEQVGGVGHPVVRPGGEVELSQRVTVTGHVLQAKKRG